MREYVYREGDLVIRYQRQPWGTIYKTVLREEPLDEWLEDRLIEMALELSRHELLKNAPWWRIKQQLRDELREEAIDRLVAEGGEVVDGTVLVPVESSLVDEADLPEEVRKALEVSDAKVS